MPLGRKHLRRNRDAPIVGWTMQRTASSLGRTRPEVNVLKTIIPLMALDAAGLASDLLLTSLPVRVVGLPPAVRTASHVIAVKFTVKDNRRRARSQRFGGHLKF